jgi:hypothetical protein
MNFVLEMVVNLLAAESSVETKVTQHLGVLPIFLFFFMENNYSLPSTFDPTIASWPETDESSPHPYKFKIHFNIHFSSTT